MEQIINITIDEFFDKFKPIVNPFASDGLFENRMFETSGEEVEFVRRQFPNRIWTLHDGYIASGFHLADRLGYFVALKSVEDGVIYQVEL